MIAVRDVEATSRWYQKVLGLESGHGGAEYEQLLSAGELVLQLHHWDVHAHPHLGDPRSGSCGNGVVLWFLEHEIDRAFERAVGQGADLLDPLRHNSNANHREFWLRDPNGYIVVVAGRRGDLG